MTELQREFELANRAEKRNAELLRQKLLKQVRRADAVSLGAVNAWARLAAAWQQLASQCAHMHAFCLVTPANVQSIAKAVGTGVNAAEPQPSVQPPPPRSPPLL